MEYVQIKSNDDSISEQQWKSDSEKNKSEIRQGWNVKRKPQSHFMNFMKLNL